jgi:hypothetical protein
MPNSEKTNDDPWRIDPDYPLADWVQEVTNDDTRQGYLDWVNNQRGWREQEQPPYTVHVGNIGNIDCDSLAEAEEVYEEYCNQSRCGYSRCEREPVTLTRWPGELIKLMTYDDQGKPHYTP